MHAPFYLEPFIVEPHRHRLLKDGQAISVEPLVMRVLTRLAQDAGAIVTRDDLMASAWPDGIAGDASLARAIWGLRRALGDQADTPRYIETIPRVGYRLIPRITPLVKPATTSTDSTRHVWLGLPPQPTGDGAPFAHSSLSRPATPPLPHPSADRNALQRTIMHLKATVAVLSLLVIALTVAVFAGQREHSAYMRLLKIKDATGRVDSIIVHSETPIDLSTTFEPQPFIP